MKKSWIRLLSLLLVITLLSSAFPVNAVQGAAISAEDPQLLTQQDYQSADDIFRQIDAMEDAPTRRNSTEKQLADEAQALVLASGSYVEDSLERNGNFFTWWTEDGVRCVYSPRMRQIHEDMQAQGKGLKYQWQYWDPGYDVWGNTTATGSKTATLEVPATLGRNGYRYCCKITDSYGNVIYSKVVTLKVK